MDGQPYIRYHRCGTSWRAPQNASCGHLGLGGVLSPLINVLWAGYPGRVSGLEDNGVLRLGAAKV